jgi:ornithine--oxo-acid transaminase
VLFEPVQGEGGVILPPDGFLRDLRALCRERDILMVADEVQSGLGRSGTTFACDREGVTPDIYILGKALGGGLYPVSAIAADADILGVITPGSHGSTFGGNPLAAAVGREVVAMLQEGEYQQRAQVLGARLEAGLRDLVGEGVVGIRVRGLWAGVDVDPTLLSGRELCEGLLERGVLAKDTHGSTIRLAPPLVATEEEIDILLEALRDTLDEAQP